MERERENLERYRETTRERKGERDKERETDRMSISLGEK